MVPIAPMAPVCLLDPVIPLSPIEVLLLMAPMGQMALVCPTAPIVYVDGNDSDRFYGSIAPGGP